MATDYLRAAETTPLIVFAGTFEEAVYADGVSEDFTFLPSSALPTI
jgi:hypothetical protein